MFADRFNKLIGADNGENCKSTDEGGKKHEDDKTVEQRCDMNEKSEHEGRPVLTKRLKEVQKKGVTSGAWKIGKYFT